MSTMLAAADEAAALEALHELACTDGLPVVIPTADRVARMVLASGYDGDIELGEMGPAYGVATIEKVAVAAVMAGCVPDHMPVVVAAVRAVCDEAFDLTEMQCTTHAIAPMLIVTGPAAAAGGFASGFGLMGPGHRANASVGRALRLAMINIGGARPGVSDMAIHGSPAKFSFCFAEAEDVSPLPSLRTGFGYGASDSAVIVLGVEGPHSVLFSGDAADEASVTALLDVLGATVGNFGSNNFYLGGRASVAVILNPEHAAILSAGGLDRAAIQREIAARAVAPRARLEQLNGKILQAGDDDTVAAVRNPEQILVLVAGAPGLYSMVTPSWCAGPHGNVAVHAAVELDQYCELPSAAG